MEDEEITSIGRKDIPAALLDNRFLDLLSRPMEQREAFLSSAHKNDELEPGYEVKIISVYTKDGAIFEHFELVLPRGTKITRHDDQSFEIDTKRFSLHFRIIFDGFRSSFPSKFEKLYLGLENDDVKPYIAKIEITVKVKLVSMLSQRGWQYFRWIDSFLTTLERDFSFDSFVHEIGWETAYSVAKITDHPKLSMTRKGRTTGRRKMPNKKGA